MDQCLVLVGNDIELDPVELDTVGRQFEPYRWHPCGVTWDAVPEQSWLLKNCGENPPLEEASLHPFTGVFQPSLCLFKKLENGLFGV